MAGVRWEHLFIKGTNYKNLNTLSPRFNARWQLNEYRYPWRLGNH